MRLQRCLVVVDGCGHRLHDRLEERLEVRAVGQPAIGGALQRGPAGLRRGIDDGELQRVVVVTLVVGTLEQVHEQLVDLVDDLGDPSVRPVHLVDAQDDREVSGQRLAQDEPGLRQGALGRIDEQDDTVDHRQAPLDLTAEIGVARGVDDVDRHALRVPRCNGRRPVVVDRRVLGEDRDALLAFEVTGVHRSLFDMLVGAEGAPLPEHFVDERGLTVVDVGDDGDVSDVAAVLRGHKDQSLRYSEAHRPSGGAGPPQRGDRRGARARHTGCRRSASAPRRGPATASVCRPPAPAPATRAGGERG